MKKERKKEIRSRERTLYTLYLDRNGKIIGQMPNDKRNDKIMNMKRNQIKALLNFLTVL